MKKYIICDIDGCLVDTAWIWKLIAQLKKNFDDVYPFEVFEKMANLSFIGVDYRLVGYIKKLINYYKDKKPTLLMMTARSETIQNETINFIKSRTDLKNFDISFRENNDCLPACESKKKRLEKILDNGNKVLMAIDDEVENLKMFAEKDIQIIQWEFGIHQYLPENSLILEEMHKWH